MSIWEFLRGDWELVSSRMGGYATLRRDNGGIRSYCSSRESRPHNWREQHSIFDLKELNSLYIMSATHEIFFPFSLFQIKFFGCRL